MKRKQLDRMKPYGEICGDLNGAKYEQDHLVFDIDGVQMLSEADEADALAAQLRAAAAKDAEEERFQAAVAAAVAKAMATAKGEVLTPRETGRVEAALALAEDQSAIEALAPPPPAKKGK